MKRTVSQWAVVVAIVAAGMLAASAVTAGEIVSVSVTPNPIVDPSKQFTIGVTGKGECDHLVVYMQVAEGGVTGKSMVWEKKNFSFGTLPQAQGTVSSNVQGISPGRKIVSAEPGPNTKKCGTKSATVVLNVSGNVPTLTPQQLPAATSGKKPDDPATIRGFNPQPEPPAKIRGFNPQPEPPAMTPTPPQLPAVK